MFVAEKYAQERRRNEEGWEERRSSGHKLNITNGITDKIILSITSLVILSVKIPRHRMICLFFNLTVIPFVISLVYTKGFFPSAYLRMYFIVELISSVTPSIKVTRHRTVWLFLFLIFPLQFRLCLLMDTWMKNYVSKVHYDISIEKFRRCFYLYLSIF